MPKTDKEDDTPLFLLSAHPDEPQAKCMKLKNTNFLMKNIEDKRGKKTGYYEYLRHLLLKKTMLKKNRLQKINLFEPVSMTIDINIDEPDAL